MNKKKLIPTNLITGFLGSGKSTAILNLLASRPDDSNWAVLVNEFGDVGIDAAMLAKKDVNDGVFIKEVPGGCICCTAGLPLQMALNLLIKKANPDRLLIELTGVGHPKKLLDTLTGEFYTNVLEVKAIICLLEVYKLIDKRYLSNEAFIDQLNCADIVLANKVDLASKKNVDYFFDFFKSSKSHIDTIKNGKFSINLLDFEHQEGQTFLYPDAHEHTHLHSASEDSKKHQEAITELTQTNHSNWQRFENNGLDFFSCGWIFHADIIFSQQKLIELIETHNFTRLKGIFHTDKGWLIFNQSEQQYTQLASDYKEDSRVEIINNNKINWAEIEQNFLACII